MNFLVYDNVIGGSSPRDKTALVGADEIRKKRKKTVNNNFCNGLIGDITKAFRAELFYGLRVLKLGDKDNLSFINLHGDSLKLEIVLNKMTDRVPYYVPNIVIKNSLEPILTRGFESFNAFDGIPDFSVS